MSQLAGQGTGDPDLPFAKVEVMRLLHGQAGLRVQDVAEALGIAPNTASTLVTQLSALGLVERRRDASDGRVARLYPTRAATARKARRRDRREAGMTVVLERLPAADRELILTAIPALNRLVKALEEGPA